MNTITRSLPKTLPSLFTTAAVTATATASVDLRRPITASNENVSFAHLSWPELLLLRPLHDPPSFTSTAKTHLSRPKKPYLFQFSPAPAALFSKWEAQSGSRRRRLLYRRTVPLLALSYRIMLNGLRVRLLLSITTIASLIISVRYVQFF